MRLYVPRLLLVLVTALLIPFSASAQQSADCVAVHDWNGTRVGRAHESIADAAVLFDHEGRVAQIVLDRRSIRSLERVYFTGANCTGDMFMVTQGKVNVTAQVVGSDVWYPDLSAAEVSFTAGSVQEKTGICNDGVVPANEVVPAYTFTMPSFTPPFHLEPEACFTPSPMVAALTPYALGVMVLVLALSAYLMMQRPQVA